MVSESLDAFHLNLLQFSPIDSSKYNNSTGDFVMKDEVINWTKLISDGQLIYEIDFLKIKIEYQTYLNFIVFHHFSAEERFRFYKILFIN